MIKTNANEILIPSSLKDVQEYLIRYAYGILNNQKSDKNTEFRALDILSIPEEIMNVMQYAQKEAAELYKSSPYHPPYISPATEGKYTKLVADKCAAPVRKHACKLCLNLIPAAVYFSIICASLEYAIRRNSLYVPVSIPENCFHKVDEVFSKLKLSMLFDWKIYEKSLYCKECFTAKGVSGLSKAFKRFVKSSKGSRKWNPLNSNKHKLPSRKRRFLKRMLRKSRRLLYTMVNYRRLRYAKKRRFPASNHRSLLRDRKSISERVLRNVHRRFGHVVPVRPVPGLQWGLYGIRAFG